MRDTRVTKSELRTTIVSLATIASFYAATAHAQAMPWENPLQQLLASLQGSTAQTIIVGAIIIAGLALCVGEAGSFFRRAMSAVFGGAVAIGAATWAPTLFGW